MSRSERRTNGQLLQLLALLHAAVGAVFYWLELREIVRDRVAAAVPNHGGRATAFWFLVPSPILWITGRLLHGAERAGDTEALRDASSVGLAAALLGATCLPLSGFWGWAAISLRGLRDARHTPA